jgi:small subunit ribosomal protein S8
MMTDPIADLLTCIRNANSIERPVTDVKATKMKTNIVRVLKEEGFIADYHVGKVEKGEFKDGAAQPGEPGSVLRIQLKYGPEGEKVIRVIKRSSRPGRRYYLGASELKKVLDGLGISILSTSKGVMSDRQARKAGVGGEVICYVW